MSGDVPYGSGHLLETLFSFPIEAVLVFGRPRREDWSPGLCDWFRVRFRGPFEAFATLTTPLERFGLETEEVFPGRRLFVVGGEEEGS